MLPSSPDSKTEGPVFKSQELPSSITASLFTGEQATKAITQQVSNTIFCKTLLVFFDESCKKSGLESEAQWNQSRKNQNCLIFFWLCSISIAYDKWKLKYLKWNQKQKQTANQNSFLNLILMLQIHIEASYSTSDNFVFTSIFLLWWFWLWCKWNQP